MTEAPAGAASDLPRSIRQPLDHIPDLVRLAAHNPARYPCLLQSVARGSPQARWDVLLAFPQSVLELDPSGRLFEDGQLLDETGFLPTLDRRWQAEYSPDHDEDLPFCGGWALFLGYELAAEIEPGLRLPRCDMDLPVAMALRCPVAIVVDHQQHRAILVAESGHADLIDLMRDDMGRTDTLPPGVPSANDWSEDPPGKFLAAVERAHDYICAGDVFQANLSRQWQAELGDETSPASLYQALGRANPAPFACLWQQAGWAVASSSPERLVEVRAGQVQTRPIAGTRPRRAGDDERARIHELVANPKERAEHIMLIDLERNDLGRVSQAGSVEVNEFMVVESHPHVHHIVSNVRGRLRAGITPGQVIAACFPGGTITGCPKRRCMEIIAELEGVGRGAYTGAIGYLDRNGDMDLNILIRSFALRNGRLSLRAGAGIVHDSVAAAELEETRDKARGLLRALGVDA